MQSLLGASAIVALTLSGFAYLCFRFIGHIRDKKFRGETIVLKEKIALFAIAVVLVGIAEGLVSAMGLLFWIAFRKI